MASHALLDIPVIEPVPTKEVFLPVRQLSCESEPPTMPNLYGLNPFAACIAMPSLYACLA
jgi:hypothetical protein